MKNFDQIAYIAPKLIRKIKSFTNDPKHNLFKSDSFSVGIVLLHSANLESCESVYNKQFSVIDKAKLDNILRKVKGKYSE